MQLFRLFSFIQSNIMEDGIENFARELQKRIDHGLPGIDAQRLMAPEFGIDKRFLKEVALNARPGAVLILFYPDDDGIRFPLIQRPTYNGAHSGQIGLPGGKKDPDDDNLTATALRETEEEIGVNRNQIRIIGALTPLFIPASNFNILPVAGYLPFKPEFVPDAFEVQSVITAHVGELLETPEPLRKMIRISSGMEIRAPYYSILGHVVWGATAMILSELLCLLKKRDAETAPPPQP